MAMKTHSPSIIKYNQLVTYLVEQVDLGDRVLRLAAVLDEQRDEADVGVQRVKALGTHQRRRRVALLAQGSKRGRMH